MLRSQTKGEERMTDLRKAAEMALAYIEQALAQHDQQYQRHPSTERDRQVIVNDLEALRQALAEPDHMIKTWQQRCEEHPDHAGIVSDGMIWARMQEEIDELRQALDKDADEWYQKALWGEQHVDNVYMSEERVHKTDKSIHGPVAWMKPSGLVSPYKHGSYQIPLYAAPPKQEYQYEVVAEHADGTYTTKRIPKRQWVGLTADEIWKCNKAEPGSAVEFHICSAHQNVLDFAEAIEEKLKEKNCDS
jgi:hypothetical protein